MPAFEQHVPSSGGTAHVVVSDELAATFRADPAWVEVEQVGGRYVPTDQADDVRAALEERAEVEEHVADLKGDALAAAAKKAGIPSTLTADETRSALVERQLHPSYPDDAADFDTDPHQES